MGVRLASSVSVVSGGGGGGGGAEGRVSEHVLVRFGEVECACACAVATVASFASSSFSSSRLRLRSYGESVRDVLLLLLLLLLVGFWEDESVSLSGGYCGVLGVASFEFALEVLLRTDFALLRSSAVRTALLMYSCTQFLIRFSWLGGILAVGSLTGPRL